jgi:hypothetical protein
VGAFRSKEAALSRGDEAAVGNGSTVVVALRPAPHEPVGVGLVSRQQGGIERCSEARVVEDQASVVGAAIAGLAPPGAELEAAGVDAVVGLVVAGLRAARDDVNAGPDGEGAERALEAAFSVSLKVPIVAMVRFSSSPGRPIAAS